MYLVGHGMIDDDLDISTFTILGLFSRNDNFHTKQSTIGIDIEDTARDVDWQEANSIFSKDLGL